MTKLSPNPFSLYDFLGYFTPGAASLYVLSTYLPRSYLRTEFSDLAAVNDSSEVLSFVLLAYVVGHLLSFISSVTIERYYLWVFGYPSKELLALPHEGFFEAAENRRLHVSIRVLVALLILPITLWDLLLRKIARLAPLYKKELDPLLQNLVHNKMSILIREQGEIEDPNSFGAPADHDFFRFVYHYAVEHAPNHFPKMQNYVALYGFLRTVSLLGVIVFWLDLSSIGGGELLWQVKNAAGISLLTYVFFLAFVKFYRRFSLEAYMAMAVSFKGANLVAPPSQS